MMENGIVTILHIGIEYDDIYYLTLEIVKRDLMIKNWVLNLAQ